MSSEQSERVAALQLVRDLRFYVSWQREQGWEGIPVPEGTGWSPPPLVDLLPTPKQRQPTSTPWAPPRQTPAPPPTHNAVNAVGPMPSRKAAAQFQQLQTLSQRKSTNQSSATTVPSSHAWQPSATAPTTAPAQAPFPQEPLQFGAVPKLELLSLIPPTSLQEEGELAQRSEALCLEIGACVRCELSETRNHLFVGSGPNRTRLMVICPQPNEQEDLTEQPLSGASGVLIKQMLRAIGVSPEEVHFVYFIKCRPPQDRLPFSKEVHTCLPFTIKQIQIIQPEVILAMGFATAQEILKTNQRFDGLRRRWFKLHESSILPKAERPCEMMATYHPQYLLKRPHRKSNAWQDLQMLRQRLLELGRPKGESPC